MAVIAILLELFAVPVASILGDFEDPALQLVLTNCLRLIAPSSLCSGSQDASQGCSMRSSASITRQWAAPYSISASSSPPHCWRLDRRLCAAAGVVLGSVLQLGLMLPGLRDIRLRLSTAWSHPAVRRILRLYMPIALGLIVTQVQIIVDGRGRLLRGRRA